MRSAWSIGALILGGGLSLGFGVVSADTAQLRIYGNYSPSSEDTEYKLLQSFWNEYQQAHPNVKIQDLGRNHNEDKLLASLVAGSGPDLVSMGTQGIFDFYDKGLLTVPPLDLAARVAKQMYPVAVRENSLAGRLVGLPGQNNVTALYYNRTILSESGLSPNVGDVTWDQLAAMAKKTAQVDASGQLTRAGMVINSVGWSLAHFATAMLWSYGGQFVDGNGSIAFGGDPAMNVFNNFKDWFTTFGSTKANFAGGKATFFFGWPFDLASIRSGDARGYKEEIGVARMPAGPAGSVAYQYGNSYGVPKGPHADEVWRLLEWFYFASAGPNGMSPLTKLFLTRGYPPIDRTQLPYLADNEDWAFFSGYANNLEVARDTEHLHQFGISSTSVLGAEVNKVIQGKVAPAQAVADVRAALTAQQQQYRTAKAKA